MEYELSTQYDSRKSFYGKANVRKEGRRIVLRSYATDVAYIIDGRRAVVLGTYSPTTLRHIKDFLLQNGFKAETSKQILEDYPEGKTRLKQEEGDGMLKTVGMIASLGDIFCKDKKEGNDWKARMLKAGLSNKGLVMPDDWDVLSEEEKEIRLDNVIKVAVEQ